LANIGKIKTVEPSFDNYKKMIKQNSQTKKTGFVAFIILIILSVGMSVYMLFNKEYAVTAIIQDKEVLYEHSPGIFSEGTKKTDKYMWKVKWQGQVLHPLGNMVQVDSEVFDAYEVGDHVVITFKGNRVVDVK